VEAVYDSLQTAGVVSNDRWIRVKHVYATEVDPVNPRVEIMIEELG
jgi:Holliday junction resolvase RusA-like endonuclease